ncbi:GNAT family N-acetyltransferase [Streptomyces sp. NPDC049879]|uniref:GNAT family N-acetyltransferase n=1 Tax=Streptomyces sp. NPDC049879 TaxID=3365598 RepID=UPI0037B1E7DB
MGRHIPFDRVHNFRDTGGYPAADGRTVRWGRFYRSDSLGKLAGEDWERFLDLGVRTVIDLRYGWEIEGAGRVPDHPSLAWHHLSVEHRPYDQPGLGPDVDPAPYLVARYGEVAHDGAAELRRALEVIADPGAGPVVIHCMSGKDRTGLLAALVLALLGVPDDDIVADFALTGLARDRLLADWRAAHGGRSPGWPGYGRAPAEVMRLFLDGLRRKYGSVGAYAEAVLGVGDDLVTALRERLLAPAPPVFRRAGTADLPALVRLRDDAARWQLAHGIDQWLPGQLGEDHFRRRLADGEVWLASAAPGGPPVGAWELWWDDPAAWGPQPPVAGYVHRLMTDRSAAPPGTGRQLLAEAERRIAEAGRELCRLDCLAGNERLRAYYLAAGYRVVGEQAAKDGGLGGSPYAVTLMEKRLLPA